MRKMEMSKKVGKPFVISIILITSLFIACVSNSPAIQKEETQPSIVLPKNVKVIDTVNVVIETEAGNYPSVSSALLSGAQAKHGNNIGIINIVEQSPKNNEEGKIISSGSTTVIRMNDDNYQALYDITPQSDDRIYGAGSAKMADASTSITIAETRARAELARTYSVTEISEETTVSTANVIITGAKAEQIVFTPDGTVWVMLSVNKENIRRVNPNDAEAYNKSGFEYGMQGDLERAIAEFTQAIMHNPSYAEAYFNRGNAYLAQDNLERAIPDLTQAIRINPNYAEAYCWRGAAYVRQGDLERAIADYTQAIRVNPNYATAYYWRGAAYLDQGGLERAIADFESTLRIDPNHAYVRDDLEYARQQRAR